MKPEHWLTLANVLLTGIGLYFAPKLAVQRALEQFRSQKWWEKQFDAYAVTLESLMVIQNYAARRVRNIEENITSTASEEYEAKARKAFSEVARQIIFSRFLLSEKAADALQAYSNEREFSPEDSEIDYYTATYKEARSCIAILTEEAKTLSPQLTKK